MEQNEHSHHAKRLVVVSNRLPFEIKKENDQVHIRSGSGGLVTALAPVLKNRGGVWIGWPGTVDIEESQMRNLIKQADKNSGFKFSPVFLTKKDIELYYQGFSNEIAWPLFHDLQGLCNFAPEYWEAYQKVNEKFADVVAHNIRHDDFIWVHDYQLMLLADELRKQNVTTKIGFFLHIPFPPLDIFIKLPWRTQILNSLLKYDLIGFQTQRDRRNFIQCVRAVDKDIRIGNHGSLHICKKGDSEIRIGAFPICIDFQDFANRASTKEIEESAWLLHEKWPKQQLVLSLDRLDYTKGILQRLEAIRTFLIRYPEFHNKVSFIQIVIPSRLDIPKYQLLKQDIDRLVGEINSQFTKENWVPINYMFRSLDRTELLAFYRTCEVALINPIKDGMNLVAKEYLACNVDMNGVLILSEFAGAAPQLHAGAVLINPYDIVGIAKALETALKMPEEEKRKRMQMMRKNVKRYDIFWWTKMYLNAAFGLDLRDLPVQQEPIPSTAQENVPVPVSVPVPER